MCRPGITSTFQFRSYEPSNLHCELFPFSALLTKSSCRYPIATKLAYYINIYTALLCTVLHNTLGYTTLDQTTRTGLQQQRGSSTAAALKDTCWNVVAAVWLVLARFCGCDTDDVAAECCLLDNVTVESPHRHGMSVSLSLRKCSLQVHRVGLTDADCSRYLPSVAASARRNNRATTTTTIITIRNDSSS